MRRKPLQYTIEDCRASATAKNGKCLSTEYTGDRIYMDWQCQKGHKWQTSYYSIRRGTWCRLCACGKYTIEECKAKAVENGGECLSETYKNANTPLMWRCSEGHEWKSGFHNILSGRWCYTCAIVKDTIQDLHVKAKSRGGLCLDDTYRGVMHFYKWRCSEGHEWSATWKNIKVNTWCPGCIGWMGTIEELHTKALERKGRCLDQTYEGAAYKYTWECEKKHTWKAEWTRINRLDQWCPICRKSRGEETIHEIFKNFEIRYIPEKTFEDCVGTGGSPLKFDFFLPEYNTAIEYDGRQHFELVDYYGGLEGFQKRIQHDAVKSNYCEQNGITLIRIAFDEDLETVLAERLERSFNEKFVMWIQISPEYENQVEAIFGEERYQTFKLEEDR